MPKKTMLGDLERTLLLALLQCGGTGYGLQIQEQIEQATDRTISPGALYTGLTRMQGKGYVKSWKGEPTAQRGGRRKRYFQVQPAGERALEESLHELRVLSRGLEPRFRLS